MGIVACLAAVASGEADAQYGHFGYAGLGHSVYAAPYRYSGAYGYAAPLTGAGITVRGYGTPATVGTHAPYGYAASGHYVADSVGAVHVAKRDAEAEPEAEADALYGNYGYGLGSPPTPDLSMEDTPHTPDPLSPAMLPHLSPLLLTPDQSMEDTPATMAREMLMLNQRLRLMLSMALMDMVLDTLPTPDLSMEDTPPTPDQSYPAMLPDQLFPPLDTLPTLDQSMEDTPAIMARERLRLNQRLMLMLSMATMDMVLDTLPTPDLSMGILHLLQTNCLQLCFPTCLFCCLHQTHLWRILQLLWTHCLQLFCQTSCFLHWILCLL